MSPEPTIYDAEGNRLSLKDRVRSPHGKGEVVWIGCGLVLNRSYAHVWHPPPPTPEQQVGTFTFWARDDGRSPDLELIKDTKEGRDEAD